MPSLPRDISEVLTILANRRRRFSVLQIGASDGGLNDPICGYVKEGRVEGVFLEPLPGPFKELSKRYSGLPGVSLQQNAVDRDCEDRIIYSIDQTIPNLPDWSYQVAGFCREVVLRHTEQLGLPDSAVVEGVVSCTTFEKLFERGITDVFDCLLIDTEGYDLEILRMFPFEEKAPLVVVYENKHLNATDRDEAAGMLVSLGYVVFDLGVDTVAMHPSSIS